MTQDTLQLLGRWRTCKHPDSQSYQRLYSPKAITLELLRWQGFLPATSKSQLVKGVTVIRACAFRVFKLAILSLAQTCGIDSHNNKLTQAPALPTLLLNQEEQP